MSRSALALLLSIGILHPLRGAAAQGGASASGNPTLPIEVTRITDQAPLYATFQSHNQKVVENRYGIFLTYLDKVKPIPSRCPNPAVPPCYGSPNLWKLVRSTDSGRTFSTVYESTDDTNAPSLETDSSGNLYLFLTHYSPTERDAYLYRFLSAKAFGAPEITRIPGAASGKYVSYLDGARQQLYYMNNNGGIPNFYTFDLSGKLLHSIQLLRNGPHAVLQYPYLAMSGSTLYAAWTTSLLTKYLYWDSHFMFSIDGGVTWSKGNGTPLPLPVVADETGAADSVVLNDEYGYHNWLSSMAAKGGFLHFMYESQLPKVREHYVRFDLRSHSVDSNIYPVWQGQNLSIRSLDGFFATDSSDASALLYAISTNQSKVGDNRIMVLASADSGRTWFDYAVSQSFSHSYAIGGARLARQGGSILGTFTNLIHPDSGATANVNEVWFFRVGAR